MLGDDEGLVTEQDGADLVEMSLLTLRRWRREGTRAAASADTCPRDGHRSTPPRQPFGQDHGAPWLGNHEERSTMRNGGHDFLSDLNDPATLGAGLTA
jgi:hypothetical protein